LYVSFAARKSGVWFVGFGASSVMSNPIMFLCVASSLKKSVIWYHVSPPGCGVPVDGIIDVSSASRSSVMYTSCVSVFIVCCIQLLFFLISSA